MIYKFVMDNLVRIGIGVAILLAVFWLYQFVTARPEAEARLGKNQTEAAAQSGRDAVNTVGAQNKAEDQVDQITKENDSAIRNAPGADAPVDSRASDAGLRSLCKRRSAHRDPKCVQFLAADGVAGGR